MVKNIVFRVDFTASIICDTIQQRVHLVYLLQIEIFALSKRRFNKLSNGTRLVKISNEYFVFNIVSDIETLRLSKMPFISFVIIVNRL